MATDIFGQTIAAPAVYDAARSNLESELQGRGLSADEAKQFFGSFGSTATQQQLEQLSRRDFSGISLPGLPAPGTGQQPVGFATSSDLGQDFTAEIKAQQEARAQLLNEQEQAALAQGQALGSKELGATEGTLKAMTGGELGFSSIEDSIIQNQVKRNESRLSAIKTEYRQARLDNDTKTMALLQSEREQRIKNLLTIDQLVTNSLQRQLSVKQENRLQKAQEFTQEENLFQRGVTTQEQLRADKSLDWQLGSELRGIAEEDRANLRKIADEERAIVQNLALEFGDAKINIGEDSIDEALRKASPFLSEDRRLTTQQKQAEIARTRQLASGSGSTSTTVGKYSGKYSEELLAQRADQYVNEDGTINWLAMDELEKTDPELWKDMQTFVMNAGAGKTQTTDTPSGPSTFSKYTTPNQSGAQKLITGTSGMVGEGIESVISWLFN